jgi:hypothetical protein
MNRYRPCLQGWRSSAPSVSRRTENNGGRAVGGGEERVGGDGGRCRKKGEGKELAVN